jgi:iron complex transport system substrate-binding protein
LKRLLYALLALTLLLSACAPAATPAPTATSIPPTAAPTKPAPTNPPAPTATTAPTAAPTAVPTAAPTTAPTAAALTFKDGLGRSVSLPAPAKKVVSLAPSNTEILYAIGAAAQTIGRDDLSDYPEAAKKLPTVGGNMGKFNYEAIAKLQPDLVLASPLNTPDQIKALEDLKLTVFVMPNPTVLDGMYQNLTTTAALTGHADEAKKLIASLQERQKKVADALANLKDRPKVFYELDATDATKPFTAGANTFIDLLIQLAGGTNIGAKLKGDYPQVSQEELLVQNPDIILLGDAAYGTTPEQVAKRAGWNTLKAVKDSKVFGVDDNLVSRPGPRLIDGLEAFAKLIHPEIFK